MKRLVLIVALLVLAACSAAPTVTQRDTAPPVAAQCAAQCDVVCTPAAWPQWQGNPLDPSTWDELGPLIDSLKGIAERCENARLACAQCLHRLERAGAICGVQRACVELQP